MTDPYTDTEVCVNRLYKEWKRHNKLIVAVDFDDTVFPFHNQDDTHHHVMNALAKCQQLGFYIVIWTASNPDRYEMISKYMEDRGIRVSSINKNPIDLPFGNHGKIYYNILLDDRAGLGQALNTLNLLFLKISG